ncbi:hypothetical protein C2S52_005401 [Perilla frutescens var. hirtella]|nr:hypothetical protein C2S52_005401 [Perilla frutescens var. hirtella]
MGFDLNLSPPYVDDSFDKPEGSASRDEADPQAEDADEHCLDGETDICRAFERSLEPSSLIEDIDEAYVLYCEYAHCKGFSVRKGCQKYFDNSSEMRMKVFNCSCEGQPDIKKSNSRLGVYKKQVTRTNCKARLRLLRPRDGLWTVFVFEKVHNHELLNPDQSYLLRSARHLQGPKKSILEALLSTGISMTRACKFLERESGGRQNVGFTRTDAYIHLGRKKAEMNVENGDSNALLQFFMEKSNKEPFFYWKVQQDDEGKLLNFFFRDSRCAVDYEYFGPITFLSDETTETFEWLFGAFLEAMYGKEPEVIFSDQCQALMNGVDYTFKTAAHRLCQWHINQNAPTHFGSLNGNVEFKKLWNRCMNGCETEDEFEEVWQQLIETYELVNNRWFSNMYNLRSRWSSVFTNDRFSAGMHATSRSEVTNRILKDLGKRSNTLYEFVVHYCEVQNEWRERENAEDALCRSMPGQFLLDNPLLTHVAKVFTRNIFKIFEYEAHHSMNIKIIEHPDYASEVLHFGLSSGPQCDVTRSVAFNKISHEVSCSCRMWESKGVFCQHIFKVLYLMNVDVMPERYILRRWTRDCKRRIVPDLKNPFKNVDDNLSGLVFVNSIMRLSYDMAYEAKGDAGSRSCTKDRGNRTGEAKQMRDPSTVNTRAKSVHRKWRNSRLKGNRGGRKPKEGSPVSFKSNEVEKSFNAPDRYWPVFCDEFNSQQSQLLSTTSVDLQHQMDNEMIRSGLLVYRPRGEPCWDQLRVLFQDVIVLSESQSIGNAPNAAASHSECVSEVVNQCSSSSRGKKPKKKSPSCSRGSSSTGYST